jgi:hypothetical protein
MNHMRVSQSLVREHARFPWRRDLAGIWELCSYLLYGKVTLPCFSCDFLNHSVGALIKAAKIHAIAVLGPLQALFDS